MDEMKRGLLEIQAEERQNQGRLESWMSSIKYLIKQRENVEDFRMSEISAVIKERDCQADERLKQMSDVTQRRDVDANTLMVDSMAAMEDFTLGVRAIVSQTALAQKQVAPQPRGFNLANIPCSSTTPLNTQTNYLKISQPIVEQTRPRKLIPPATYKRDLTKARVMHAESTDPMAAIPTLRGFSPARHQPPGITTLRRAVWQHGNLITKQRLPARSPTRRYRHLDTSSRGQWPPARSAKTLPSKTWTKTRTKQKRRSPTYTRY